MSDLELLLPLCEPDLGRLPLDLLRARREELLAECARASRWRRLVQARMDLAVNRAAPADDLHGPWTRVQAQLSDVVAEPGEVDGGGAVDAVRRLHQVSAARTALAHYTEQLRHELEAATDELVGRYQREPGVCLTPGGRLHV